MKTVVVAVWDGAVGAFNRPFYAPSVGAAVRSFTDEVNRKAPDNSMNQHPEDFSISVLAEFDEESGIFNQLPEGVRVIARGKDVISHE